MNKQRLLVIKKNRKKNLSRLSKWAGFAFDKPSGNFKSRNWYGHQNQSPYSDLTFLYCYRQLT